MMCISPSKPFPSTTPPTQRMLSCKLALFIPTTSSAVDAGVTPAPQKQTSTPIQTSRPRLSLKLGSDTKRPFASFAPLSLDTSKPAVRRPSIDSDAGDDDELTARNTLANTQIKVDGCNDSFYFPTLSYTLAPGTKSILKKKGVSFAKPSKAVSFQSGPSYMPTPQYEDSDVSSDEDNMSPPSTTSSSSADSEESESDNEARTPVDDSQSGWMTKRLADKPGFGGGGKWKRAKRTWAWTIEDDHDIKVWGEDIMAA